MDPLLVLLLALLISVVAGLRSLTAPAAGGLGRAPTVARPAPHLCRADGSTGAVVIFTLLALVELVADKLPSTPARIAPPASSVASSSGELMIGQIEEHGTFRNRSLHSVHNEGVAERLSDVRDGCAVLDRLPKALTPLLVHGVR